MSKRAFCVWATIVAAVCVIAAIPAQAEPRKQRSKAGLEVVPAQVGWPADAWQKMSPEVIQKPPADAVQKVPLGAIQEVPLEPVPSMPMPSMPVPSMPMPAVQKGEITCCPSPGCGCPQQRHVEYRNHCRMKKGAYACAPPVQTVLVVPSGSCCQCAVEVPVCIPACCTDTPQVDAKRGLFGRTRVLYRWCCGFEVEVVFCHNGDLIVHYDGV